MPIITSTALLDQMPSTVSAAPLASASAIVVCTARDTSSGLRAPKNCEIMTDAPEDRPTKKPTSRLISVPVVPPTAASASLPTNLPTIMASAVL